MELDDTPTAQCGWCNGTGRAPSNGYDCEQCQGDGWVFVPEPAKRAQAQKQGSE